MAARSLLPEMCNLCRGIISDESCQLSCNHSFCKKCLGMFVSAFVKDETFSCSVCGTSQNISDVDLGEDWKTSAVYVASVKPLGANEKPSQSCKQSGHNNLELQLYCRQHEKLICGKCLLQDHKDCSENVHDIHEEATGKREALKQLQLDLDKYNKKIEVAEKENEKSFVKAEQEIQQMKTKVFPIFETQKNEIRKLSSIITSTLDEKDDPYKIINNDKEIRNDFSTLVQTKLLRMKFSCAVEEYPLNLHMDSSLVSPQRTELKQPKSQPASHYDKFPIPYRPYF